MQGNFAKKRLWKRLVSDCWFTCSTHMQHISHVFLFTNSVVWPQEGKTRKALLGICLCLNKLCVSAVREKQTKNTTIKTQLLVSRFPAFLSVPQHYNFEISLGCEIRILPLWCRPHCHKNKSNPLVFSSPDAGST